MNQEFKGKLRDMWDKLDEGMFIKLYEENKKEKSLRGIILEIDERQLSVAHNIPIYDGSVISKSPKSIGYKYSHTVGKDFLLDVFISYSDHLKEENCSYCKRDNGKLYKIKTKLYCEECMNYLHCKCEVCGKIVEEGYLYMTISKEKCCKKCLTEKYNNCTSCHYYVKKENCKNFKDMIFCKKCYERNILICPSCEKLECKGDMRLGIDGLIYCFACWDDRYAYCAICGHIGYLDNLIWDDDRNSYMCSDCNNRENGRSKMIHDYSFKPKASFKKMKYENKEEENKDSIFMGVELEVQHTNVADKATLFDKFLKRERVAKKFYFKRDGSVDNGFEIVTHPFTLKYAHSKLKFNKILTWLQKNKFTSFESGKCGLHIHLDKNFFEELDIAKMRLFFLKNKSFIEKFSNRNGIGMNYCNFETTSVKNILNNEVPNGRYWALNLNSSEETVEMRIFRGTLDYERFISILQFADAISHFVKIHGIASFIMGEYKYKNYNNSWLMFTDWAKKECKYNQMLSFFRKEKLLCV
jgi:hypothetical protein